MPETSERPKAAAFKLAAAGCDAAAAHRTAAAIVLLLLAGPPRRPWPWPCAAVPSWQAGWPCSIAVLWLPAVQPCRRLATSSWPTMPLFRKSKGAARNSAAGASSAASAAAASRLAPAPIGEAAGPAEAGAAAAAAAGPKCPTRPFGKTGLQMPVLSCGGMRHNSAAALDAVVDRALSFGVNHFETARMYMGGRSEKDFGRTLQRYPRESYILQTKVAPKADPRRFEADVLSSMKNLRTDYLDLFAFHGVNRLAELDHILREGGCLEIAQRLQKEGKIRHIGFSTHAPTPVILQAIQSGAFSYVNLHYHVVGSYTSSGTALDGAVGCGGSDGVPVADGGNGVAVAAACAAGMGVFIIR